MSCISPVIIPYVQTADLPRPGDLLLQHGPRLHQGLLREAKRRPLPAQAGDGREPFLPLLLLRYSALSLHQLLADLTQQVLVNIYSTCQITSN